MPLKNSNNLMVRLFLWIIPLLQCYIVLFQFFSIPTSFLILIGLWILFFGINLNRNGFKIALIRAIIYSIPLSFSSIMGTDYGNIPLSYFNLFSLCLLITITLEWIVKGKLILKKNYLFVLLSLLLIYSVIPTVYSMDISIAIKQYLNILLFCILIILALVTIVPSDIIKTLIEDYLRVALVTCIGLFTQIALFKYTGNIYGKLDIFGGMRTAYGFLFSDYSFLSLYLSSAALITIALAIYNRKINYLLIIYSIMLTFGSILTTARTGIVAMLCALLLYGIILFFKRPLITISVVSIVILLTGFYMGYSANLRADIIGGSGRVEGYTTAIEELSHKPFFGIGYGVQSYNQHYGEAIPHNIFIQYFVQGGLVGGILVLIIIISSWLIVYKNANPFFAAITSIIIGAQFIPDIFNSRFFPVVLMVALLSIGNYTNKEEITFEENSTHFI